MTSKILRAVLKIPALLRNEGEKEGTGLLFLTKVSRLNTVFFFLLKWESGSAWIWEETTERRGRWWRRHELLQPGVRRRRAEGREGSLGFRNQGISSLKKCWRLFTFSLYFFLLLLVLEFILFVLLLYSVVFLFLANWFYKKRKKHQTNIETIK